MAFQKLLAFTKKVADLADQPTLTPAELKAQFDAAPEELRGSFNQLVDDLNTLNPASKTQETNVAPTLLNGWVDAQGTRYFKDNFGIVHIYVEVANGTGTGGTTIFTMPAGYRPADVRRPIGVRITDGTFLPFYILTSGEVKLLNTTPAGSTIAFAYSYKAEL